MFIRKGFIHFKLRSRIGWVYVWPWANLYSTLGANRHEDWSLNIRVRSLQQTSPGTSRFWQQLEEYFSRRQNRAKKHPSQCLIFVSKLELNFLTFLKIFEIFFEGVPIMLLPINTWPNFWDVSTYSKEKPFSLLLEKSPFYNYNTWKIKNNKNIFRAHPNFLNKGCDCPPKTWDTRLAKTIDPSTSQCFSCHRDYQSFCFSSMK